MGKDNHGFVTALPRIPLGYEIVWVIVDCLTKSAHFIPLKLRCSIDKLAWIYIRKIVRLHGVPESIVSNRDPRFVSRFWKSLHEALGTKLNFSTTYYLETNGQSKQVIQILEDMLRACALDFGRQ